HPILNPRIWGVAGTDSDTSRRVQEDYMGGPLTKIRNFVGTGIFSWQTLKKGDFDYLKLSVPSGQFGFPYRYEGMSGGGFWLLPMEIDGNSDVNTIGLRPPILTGVEFSQLDRD